MQMRNVIDAFSAARLVAVGCRRQVMVQIGAIYGRR